MKQCREAVFGILINNISIKNSDLQAPKLFRRCKHISLDHVFFSNAEETMWTREDVKIKNAEINGDYFGKDSLDTYGSRENCIFMSKISRNSSIR